MYILQNGKLYVQDGDKLVGVEIYLDKGSVRLDKEVAKLSDTYEMCTKADVICRFHLSIDNPYIFPREVIDNEPVSTVKGTRKPKRE